MLNAQFVMHNSQYIMHNLNRKFGGLTFNILVL